MLHLDAPLAECRHHRPRHADVDESSSVPRCQQQRARASDRHVEPDDEELEFTADVWALRHALRLCVDLGNPKQVYLGAMPPMVLMVLDRHSATDHALTPSPM